MFYIKNLKQMSDNTEYIKAFQNIEFKTILLNSSYIILVESPPLPKFTILLFSESERTMYIGWLPPNWAW